MARTMLEYIEAGVVREMAETLIERYPSQLGHIDVEDVYFAFCVSKKPKNSVAVQLASVRKPLTRKVTTRPYQIAIFRDTWEGWTETQQALQLLHALYAISPDGDGIFRTQDVHDFYPFVAALGPQWEHMDPEGLPNPLKDKIKFPEAIAPNEDEGASITEQKAAAQKDPVLKQILDEEKSKNDALAARAEKIKRGGKTDPATSEEDEEDEEDEVGGKF